MLMTFLALLQTTYVSKWEYLYRLGTENVSLYGNMDATYAHAKFTYVLEGRNFSITSSTALYLAKECIKCKIMNLRVTGSFRSLFYHAQDVSFENVVVHNTQQMQTLLQTSYGRANFTNVSLVNVDNIALIGRSYFMVVFKNGYILNSSFNFFTEEVPLLKLDAVKASGSKLIRPSINLDSAIVLENCNMTLTIGAYEADSEVTPIYANTSTFVIYGELRFFNQQNSNCTNYGELNNANACTVMKGYEFDPFNGATVCDDDGFNICLNDSLPADYSYDISEFCKEPVSAINLTSFADVECTSCNFGEPGVGPCYGECPKGCPQALCTKHPDELNRTYYCNCTPHQSGDACEKCEAGYLLVGIQCLKLVGTAGTCYIRNETTIECVRCNPGYKLRGKKCEQNMDGGVYALITVFAIVGVAMLAAAITLIVICIKTRAPKYLSGYFKPR